ncbi:MAG: hypothetical protein ACRYFX_06910 [Janthinobacterium lividum]
MKTSFGLLCLLAICLVATSFQANRRAALALSEWVTCQVDSQFSVQVPVQATEADIMKMLDSQGIKPSEEQLKMYSSMKAFAATDEVANYMVNRFATSAKGDINAPGKRTALCDEVISTILQNEHGTLLQRSTFTVNGSEGIQVAYKGLHKGTGKMIIKYNRTIVLGSYGYTLTSYSVSRNDTTGITSQEQRKRFFNSIVYKPSPKLSK